MVLFRTLNNKNTCSQSFQILVFFYQPLPLELFYQPHLNFPLFNHSAHVFMADQIPTCRMNTSHLCPYAALGQSERHKLIWTILAKLRGLEQLLNLKYWIFSECPEKNNLCWIKCFYVQECLACLQVSGCDIEIVTLIDQNTGKCWTGPWGWRNTSNLKKLFYRHLLKYICTFT